MDLDLFAACLNGEEEAIAILLDNGANVEAKDNDGYTPLLIACKNGHKEVVSLLLEKEASIEVTTKSGSTPLMFACEKGLKEVVSILIENGANIEAVDQNERTPLHLACENGHKEVVSLLLDKGANMEATEKNGYPPFFSACWKGHREVVSLLLEKGVNIEATDKNGKTPLQFTCATRHIEVVSLLLKKGANLEATDENRWTPLMIACLFGHIEMISLLLDKGANIEATDINGSTPLHILSRNGHKEVVSLLIEKGANMEAKFNYESTPLMLACQKGFPDVVAILIKNGANMETTSFDGSSLLHNAIRQGHMKVVSLLLEKGANIETTDDNGCTLLHLTCQFGWKNEAYFLLEKGANIEATNKNGFTSLHISCENGHQEMISLLLEKGANIEATNKSGETPIVLATKHPDIMILLLRSGARFEPPQKTGYLSSIIRKKIPPREYGLKVACENKFSPEIISLLLSKGANPSQLLKKPSNLNQNIIHLLMDKESALFLACELWGGDVFDIHVSRGANPQATNKDGHSPLLIAILNDNEGLVPHLIHKYNFDIPLEVENKNLLLILKERNLLRMRSWIWNHIVQDVKYIELVRQSLLADSTVYSILDRYQRLISTLALPEVLKVMDEALLMFGRYRLLEDRPEHQSATCFVFKAEDQRLTDESGAKKKVALKLMLRMDQFLREVEMRSDFKFDEKHLISVLTQHPSDPSEISSRPEVISLDPSRVVNGVPAKSLAESMFAISLPLADRNLFVALKQERFAGKDWNMVKFIFKELVEAVAHVHSKGVIHADLKPLNLVRVNGDWKLIDFDACCRIGVDHTGLKSSSAFCPPESIYVDRSVSPAIASVRSQEHKTQSGLSYDLVLAHPSFDVWGLGCIFYMLCTDCRMLFQGGQDDNLRADDGADSLFHLAEWSDGLKTQKLSVVEDPLARNLLSQMLMKEPTKRPTLARILEHPFVTGRQVSRLVGEKAEFDVFLSYRVWSDASHVEYLYDKLTAEGLKVWWDKKELKDGENWEEGFCNGLVKSRIFVPFLSKQGLSNFSTLKDTSPCDNVFLEHRLALELKESGLIEAIFPIILGDEVAGSLRKIDWSTIFPVVSDVSVSSVETNTCHHLQNHALGSPFHPDRTVFSVLSKMKKMQGALIDGDYEEKMSEAARRILYLIRPPLSESTPEASSQPVLSSLDPTSFLPLGVELSDECLHALAILAQEFEKIPMVEQKAKVLSNFRDELPGFLNHLSQT